MSGVTLPRYTPYVPPPVEEPAKRTGGRPKGYKIGVKHGGGSRKGIPNRITSSLKEMVLTALTQAGGVEYLQRQAEENPTSFLWLVGKVLPLTVTGAGDGAPIVINVVSTRWNDDGGDLVEAEAVPMPQIESKSYLAEAGEAEEGESESDP